MTRAEFLYLCEEDTIAAGVLDSKACFEVIEEAARLVGIGDYLMGGKSENEHGLMLFFPREPRFKMPVKGPDRRFMAMPAYLGGRFDVCGNKWYGSNIENSKRGLPRSTHLITLNDQETGLPLCVMVANLISAMRTGSVPGVAAKYLAPEAEIVGIVGGGVINRGAAKSLAVASGKAKEIKIYDIIPDKGAEFARQMTKDTGVPVRAVDSLEACVSGSDIIHFCSAGRVSPALDSSWLKSGALVEISHAIIYDEQLVKASNVVMDKLLMHKVWHESDPDLFLPSVPVLKMIEAGRLSEEHIMDLADIVAGKHQGRYNNGKTTMFLASGMPVWDVAWACQIYRNALARGLGQKLKLWDAPCWR